MTTPNTTTTATATATATERSAVDYLTDLATHQLAVEDAALDHTGGDPVTPGVVELAITGLVSPTYRAMTALVYRALVRPRELAGLHRHQLSLGRGGPGELVVVGQPDPDTNRIADLDPVLADQLRTWLTLLDPDPTSPLFPTRWHPGWRTALARSGARHGHRRLTPETCHRAGLTRRWATNPATPAHMANIVGLHPNPTTGREVA